MMSKLFKLIRFKDQIMMIKIIVKLVMRIKRKDSELIIQKIIKSYGIMVKISQI